MASPLGRHAWTHASVWAVVTVLPACLCTLTRIDASPQRRVERSAALSAAGIDRDELSSLGLPDTIQVDTVFHEIVRGMLRGSATFREQCARLGQASHLLIRLRLDSRGPGVETFSRARCRIARYEFGRVDAQVYLWSLYGAPELIAHEFEHVAEYVEGVNYHRLSRERDSGVWLTPTGAFETTRAVRIGQDVAQEILPPRASATTRRR